MKSPKMLRPIKFPPPPLRTLLQSEEDYRKAISQYNFAKLKQFLDQLIQLAEIAETTVGELLENKPLLTAAERINGLGAIEHPKEMN